jgi:hypothetical protein
MRKDGAIEVIAYQNIVFHCCVSFIIAMRHLGEAFPSFLKVPKNCTPWHGGDGHHHHKCVLLIQTKLAPKTLREEQGSALNRQGIGCAGLGKTCTEMHTVKDEANGTKYRTANM